MNGTGAKDLTRAGISAPPASPPHLGFFFRKMVKWRQQCSSEGYTNYHVKRLEHCPAHSKHSGAFVIFIMEKTLDFPTSD